MPETRAGGRGCWLWNLRALSSGNGSYFLLHRAHQSILLQILGSGSAWRLEGPLQCSDHLLGYCVNVAGEALHRQLQKFPS